MHVWDVEVLYAIRGLFRECVQEVKVEFGVGSVGEVSSFFVLFRVFVFADVTCREGLFPSFRGTPSPIRKGVSSMSKIVWIQWGLGSFSQWKRAGGMLLGGKTMVAPAKR